ncbi:RNA polymerase sigma factor, partial [Corynebacterium casei]
TRQQARRARVNSSVPPEELTHYEGEGASVSNGEASLVDCDLWALVEALPIRQREAIAYHFLGGLSHAETAALTGSNPDAVRRAAADGMKKLRKIYDDE